MSDGNGRAPGLQTPLILLVDDQEWTSRSIESILHPKGYAVIRAFTARQAVDLVGKVSPDAILVDFHLPDRNGIDVVLELRKSQTVSPATPILMISTSNINRAARLSALGAGVWDILRHPVDSGELVLRLDTFVRVKQSTDRLSEEGLTDALTGFYNAHGLLRRTREISADSRRLQRAVGCMALGGDLFEDRDLANGEGHLRSEEEELVQALRKVTRLSDAVGRLPTGEFVVVAPGADDEGMQILIERMTAALTKSSRTIDRAQSVERLLQRLRAGYYTAGLQTPIAPEDLLLRATQALRRAQVEENGGGFRARAYRA